MDDSPAADPLSPKYRRVVLKLSGDGFGLSGKSGISIDETLNIARQAQRVVKRGVQLAIVVGGGNFLRGAQLSAGGSVIKEATADYMGMLATVLNGLALQDALESLNCQTRLQTAIRMESVAEPYIRRRAIRHLEKGRIAIFAAGTSNPYFSTDTGATLRALEIKADVIAKATRVDGVFDKDPLKFPDAVQYREISYLEVLSQGLGVMDATAIAMCRDNRLPIIVFNLNTTGNIMRMSRGESVGTVIH